MYIFTLIFLSFISLISFYYGTYFPIGFSVFILFLLTLKNIVLFKRNKIGLLSLSFYIIYVLPFIHLLEYFLIDLAHDSPVLMWGLLVRESMLDNKVVSLTGMIGCSGALGISIGFNLKKLSLGVKKLPAAPIKNSLKTVHLIVWFLFLLLGIVLSNLTSPQSNIFTAGYGESKSTLYDSNFSSSWMVSYSILTFLFVDAMLESKHSVKKIKWNAILLSIFYILIFNQLLRGDRDSLPWLISLLMINFFWKYKFIETRQYISIFQPKFVFLFFLLFFTSLLLGFMRNSVIGLSSLGEVLTFLSENSELISSNVLHGTWSAVLLTPLSLANDYIYNSLDFNLGTDYVDLFLSSPPGFIADVIGYSRPWDVSPDPAMKLVTSETSTGGGIHLSATAFWNFGLIGVIFIGLLWGYMMKEVELFANSSKPFLGLTLIGVCTLAIPHAMWYGEKNFLNAIVIWFLFYKLFSFVQIINGNAKNRY